MPTKSWGASSSFDKVFDAVENDLLSQEYLGASGVRAIYESDERVPGTAHRACPRAQGALAAPAHHLGTPRARDHREAPRA